MGSDELWHLRGRMVRVIELHTKCQINPIRGNWSKKGHRGLLGCCRRWLPENYYSSQQQKVTSIKRIITITELVVVWSVCSTLGCQRFLWIQLNYSCNTLHFCLRCKTTGSITTPNYRIEVHLVCWRIVLVTYKLRGFVVRDKKYSVIKVLPPEPLCLINNLYWYVVWPAG